MNACVCMVGWHFQQELILSLGSIADLKLFIISHKPHGAVPEWLTQLVPGDQVFYEENIGYDWGAYQQFIDKKIWRKFETIFFLHDDLAISDLSVFHVCNELLMHQGINSILGNGRVSIKRDWPRTHIQSYAHSIWKPPSWDFEHDTVRGSFFAVPRNTLEQVVNFEILWDRKKLYGIGAGNYSLRATCGKIQQILGNDSFLFLSETYRHSSYVIEMERGAEQMSKTELSLRQKMVQFFLVRFSIAIMTWYMNAKPSTQKRLEGQMQTIFRIL